jgi:hypothetical protein
VAAVHALLSTVVMRARALAFPESMRQCVERAA